MEWFSYKWLNMSHIFTVGSINLTFRLTEFDEMLMVRLGKLFYHSSCQERMALLSVYIDGYYFHLVFFSSFLRYTHTQANVSRVSSHLNKKKWFSYALVFLSMLSEKVKEVIKLKKVDFWVTAFVYTANYKLSRSQHADNITPDNIPIRITKQIAI